MKKKKLSTLREWNRRRNYFMKEMRMDFVRLFLDHKRPRPFDLSTGKHVLILRDDDKIGDMVVSTSLFREFHRAGFIVDVLAGKGNVSVIEHNPWINKTIVSPQDAGEKRALAKMLAKKPYDLVVDMGDKMSPAHLRFLRTLNARNVIGFNKSKFNIYNKSIDFFGYDKHITARYELLMEAMNFEAFSSDYELHCPPEVMQSVDSFFGSFSNNNNTVVINPFTADPKRDFTERQLTELVGKIHEAYPGVNIILIGVPKRIQQLNVAGTHINPFNTLSSAIEIVRRADLVITPDTSIVHVACAWKKPLVGLYGNDLHGRFINSSVWGPGNTRAVQLFTKDKYHPVSTIAVDDIIAAIKTLL